MIKTDVHVRWMIRRDMDDVMDIEKQNLEYLWDEEMFIKHLRRRNCIGMVAELERVVGFMIYSLEDGFTLIHNFAVDRDFRRHGIGTAMIDTLKRKLNNRRREIITIVSDANLGGHLFLRANEFLAIEVHDDEYVFDYRADG